MSISRRKQRWENRESDRSNAKKFDYEYKTSKLTGYDNSQLASLKDALEKEDGKFLSGRIKEEYNKIQNKGHLGKHYKQDDSIFRLIPTNDPDQRDSIYVTGPSGSCKSTFCGDFIEYLKRFPKRPIVLFSNKKEDEKLDVFKPLRIPLNYNLVEDIK